MKKKLFTLAVALMLVGGGCMATAPESSTSPADEPAGNDVMLEDAVLEDEVMIEEGEVVEDEMMVEDEVVEDEAMMEEPEVMEE